MSDLLTEQPINKLGRIPRPSKYQRAVSTEYSTPNYEAWAQEASEKFGGILSDTVFLQDLFKNGIVGRYLDSLQQDRGRMKQRTFEVAIKNAFSAGVYMVNDVRKMPKEELEQKLEYVMGSQSDYKLVADYLKRMFDKPKQPETLSDCEVWAQEANKKFGGQLDYLVCLQDLPNVPMVGRYLDSLQQGQENSDKQATFKFAVENACRAGINLVNDVRKISQEALEQKLKVVMGPQSEYKMVANYLKRMFDKPKQPEPTF